MTYSTLMVHVDVLAPQPAPVQVAAGLAAAFGARLIGVAACEEPQSPYFQAGSYAEEMLARDRTRIKQRLNDAETRFRQDVGGALKDVDWRGALDFPTSHIVREGRAADLIVAACADDALLADPVTHLDPGALVMQAGRPVLLVPPTAATLALDSVVVAFKDAREARRAIADALPLLARATKVAVVEIVETADATEAAKRRLADVAAWLARHGIQASGHALAAASAQDRLDAFAAEAHADFIVAGAYGHSRLGEWIFGGVTRHLFTRCTRCLLLAH